ncbi:MAG TPA: hypothetical protein VIV11_00965, partial [Kofleriaceae bacterium]
SESSPASESSPPSLSSLLGEITEPVRSPISVVELVDATPDAAKLGFKCEVLVSPELITRIAPARVLEALRDALLATERDTQMELLRTIAFRGERLVRERKRRPGSWEELRRFYARAATGIGGITEPGDILAISVDGVMVIVQAGHVPHMPPIPRTQPRLFLTGVVTLQNEDALLMPL